MSSSSLLWEFPNLNGNVHTPFESNTEPNASFEKLWKDARGLEDEIEVLKWMARRKELEWDCAKEMVDKKKSTIKAVKKKINMVKTINDLGPQLNVDSDDEDTPFEDDDGDDSLSENDIADSTLSSNNGADVRFCLRQPSPIPKSTSLVSEKNRNKFAIPDFVSKTSRFSRGHLCLKCKEKPALGLCNICKNYWYCGTSCQIKDWPDHQRKCTNESDKKKTTSVFNRDHLIKFPIASDLFTSLEHKSRKRRTKQTTKSTNCIKCRQNLPYFLCSDCKNFWYCSHKCHMDHWEEHKKFCCVRK